MKYLVIIIVSVLMAGSATAQPGRGFQGEMGKCRTEMKEKLNLTEEQETAIKQIRRESGKSMIDLRADMKKKRLDVRALMDSDNVDGTKLEQLFREQADLQIRMKMAMFETRQKIMAELNADQQKIWKEMKPQRRMGKRGKGMRGDRGCRGERRHR